MILRRNIVIKLYLELRSNEKSGKVEIGAAQKKKP